ncbi:Golgin subfamily a member 5 [Globisporangium polare]
MSENASPSVLGSTSYGSSATDAEIAWLRRCLPVFVQPEVDIANHNQLVKVFFQFERQEDSGQLFCKLCIVFAGESSYNRVKEESENTCATILYRTFNRRTYKRTADINYMEFRNVNLDPTSATPWGSVFSQDHGGEQQWSQGAKKNVGDWFSLMHHYRAEVSFADWKTCADSHRPFVYLNTCNHMIGERDNNARLEKHEWVEYPFEEGDAQDAFQYVVAHIPTKFNLYSYLCFWSARNGGGCCDRHHAGKVTRSGGSIYVQHATNIVTGAKDVSNA